MARTNIFELLEESNDLSRDTERLQALFERWNFAYMDLLEASLKQFVDDYCFLNWKCRGHCLDVEDFLDSIGYDDIVNRASTDLDDFLTLIEIIYNFWIIAYDYAQHHGINLYSTADQLQELMDNCLSEYNHCIVHNKKKEQVFVVEKNPAITAAAEVSAPEIALDIFKYNHRSLRGNLKAKWAILAAMGKDLEGKRSRIESINRDLSKHIFLLLNNLDIRHNNTTPDTPKYKGYVASLTPCQLELWYDELYQMMLLAILALEQVEREPRVKELESHFGKP